jgi:hypothetical protein
MIPKDSSRIRKRVRFQVEGRAALMERPFRNVAIKSHAKTKQAYEPPMTIRCDGVDASASRKVMGLWLQVMGKVWF